MQPNPASQHKPPSKPLCADLWPTRHTGQHRPTSAHQTDAVGHLWRSVKAVIQKSPPPKHSKNRGEKKKQDKGQASQVAPARPQLPAVRAVSRRPRRGQNGERNRHLGSRTQKAPVFQDIYRGRT